MGAAPAPPLFLGNLNVLSGEMPRGRTEWKSRGVRNRGLQGRENRKGTDGAAVPVSHQGGFMVRGRHDLDPASLWSGRRGQGPRGGGVPTVGRPQSVTEGEGLGGG